MCINGQNDKAVMLKQIHVKCKWLSSTVHAVLFFTDYIGVGRLIILGAKV